MIIVVFAVLVALCGGGIALAESGIAPSAAPSGWRRRPAELSAAKRARGS